VVFATKGRIDSQKRLGDAAVGELSGVRKNQQRNLVSRNRGRNKATRKKEKKTWGRLGKRGKGGECC